MIFIACDVYNGASLVGSWATAPTPDRDGVIGSISDVRLGLSSAENVPEASVEMTIALTASTVALLGDLPKAFKLTYKLYMSVDGTLTPIGVYYHSSELPRRTASSITIYLQDAVSRVGSMNNVPTLADVVTVGDATTNPLFGNLEDFAYLRGSEQTPVRIAFGTDQYNLGTPIWTKRRRAFLGDSNKFGFVHFLSHVSLQTTPARAIDLFAFDGGAQLPQSFSTVYGTQEAFDVTVVPVTKGAMTWQVHIVSVNAFAITNFIDYVDPNDPNYGSRPLISTDFVAPSAQEIYAKYTAETPADIWNGLYIQDILGIMPMSMTFQELTEFPDMHDGASAIYFLLLACESNVSVDSDSFQRSRASSREVAGYSSGTVRETMLAIGTASGVHLCASPNGEIQFVSQRNAQAIEVSRFSDVEFYWRDTGGRGAAINGAHLVNVKRTPATIEGDAGNVMLESSALYLAGVRDVLAEVDGRFIPRQFHSGVDSLLAYLGTKPDGVQLMRFRLAVRDGVALHVGDNITFTYERYIGDTPQIVTAMVEALTYTLDHVEVECADVDLAYAPYMLPGDRLQSIMPAMQNLWSSTTYDPEFQSGVAHWVYVGTQWTVNGGGVLMTNIGTFDVWIRYVVNANHMLYAPATLTYDVTDGLVLSRAIGDLEAATTTLSGLDNYDVVAAQDTVDAIFAASGIATGPLTKSSTFGSINDYPILSTLGISQATFDALQWGYDSATTIIATCAGAAFFNTAGWCAVVDGVGYELDTVLVTGGFISITFVAAASDPFFRYNSSGYIAAPLHFAQVNDIGFSNSTGALTDNTGSGAPTGARLIA